MENSLKQIKEELLALKNPDKIEVLQRFFKTGKGEYGEGDIFLGITVPILHSIAKKYYVAIDLDQILTLLRDPIHEFRLVALDMLVNKYQKTKDIEEKKRYFDFYMTNYKYINNWDLVDLTAPKISGDYIQKYLKDTAILFEYANSENLWARRISILATYTYIKAKDNSLTFKIADILMNDKADLIQKAVGWMLRECGKANEKELIEYLDKNAGIMPRTMLRYAIEKFNPEKRSYYLKI